MTNKDLGAVFNAPLKALEDIYHEFDRDVPVELSAIYYFDLYHTVRRNIQSRVKDVLPNIGVNIDR